MLKKSILMILLFLPVTCWAFIKPVRILAPEWNGLSCVTANICVEDKARFTKANELYVDALNYVNSKIDQIDRSPRVLFCKTEKCFRSFGFKSPAKAKAIGVFAIIVGPKGWKDYIIRHEIIHHLQTERLGTISQMAVDEWFTEGMAYSMSEDPRELNEKWSRDRKQFELWYASIERSELWEKAKKL
ncbi:hypothetical protein [Ketobacter sp.]